ncbi:MAG: hypothetical protein HOK28_17365 [Deltaproteobacteria bacterium]|nr:hypothetical protein [Deltaproteobacteria bacterium]
MSELKDFLEIAQTDRVQGHATQGSGAPGMLKPPIPTAKGIQPEVLTPLELSTSLNIIQLSIAPVPWTHVPQLFVITALC